MSWSIRNYNAWIRAARKAGKLDLATARLTYRVQKEKTGRALKGADVKNHPRIFKDSAIAARVEIAKRTVKQQPGKRKRVKHRQETPGEIGGFTGGGGGGGAAGAGGRTIDLQDWDSMFDAADFYDEIEIESSADYGEE